MKKIKKFNLDKLTWNNYLSNFDEISYFQSFEYGEYFREIGWNVSRLIVEDNDSIKLLAQIFIKKRFGIFIIWIPGGPIGDLESNEKFFIDYLKENFKYFYIKFNSVAKYINNDFLYFKKPIFNQTTEKKMELKIYRNFVDNYSRFSKNWRHNYNRSIKKNLIYGSIENIDYHDLYKIYEEMTKIKNINIYFHKENIKHLINKCKSSLIYFHCTKDNNLLSARLLGFINENAFDLIAATNKEGRKYYASYFLFTKIFEDFNKKKIKKYDLSGVDPIRNAGVYNFKKGLGSKLINCIGEWDYSNLPFFRILISLYLFIIIKK